ncbi:hypothetical protein JCM16358_01820 [Halanaerocella petrolearia]
METVENRILKNYQLDLSPLGNGRFGVVYLAKELNSKSKVAIKELYDIKLAQHETSVMKKYRVHPFLPQLYDFFIVEDKAYIVMEY